MNREHLEVITLLVASLPRQIAVEVEADPGDIMESRFFAGYMQGIPISIELTDEDVGAAFREILFTMVYGDKASTAYAKVMSLIHDSDRQAVFGSDCGLADGLRYLSAISAHRVAIGWDKAIHRAVRQGGISSDTRLLE